MADRAPVWPGTGEAFQFLNDGQWKYVLPTGDELILHDMWKWNRTSGFCVVGTINGEELCEVPWGTPQNAVNALHARLCEQHDALAAVTGRGTVARAVAMMRRRADELQDRAAHAATLGNMDAHKIRWGKAVVLRACADDIERGEHIPTHEETE